MRVFLAGATGAIGKRLVPLLVPAGHQVRDHADAGQGHDASRSGCRASRRRRPGQERGHEGGRVVSSGGHRASDDGSCVHAESETFRRSVRAREDLAPLLR
jgi:nucleoside-diphosphate-sugar epimerase